MKVKDIDDLIKIVEVISQINIPNYIISINSDEIIKTLEEVKLILPDVRCSDCEIEEIVEQNKDYVLGFYTGDELKEYLSNNYA
jgi:hypothetical protein